MPIAMSRHAPLLFIAVIYPPLASRSPAHKRVLYVEDQPANVLLMRSIFERRPDDRLGVALDGDSALRAAADFRPDLLLLDLNLPDCLGTDLLARLRLIRACAHVPAVVVTADHEFDIRGTGFCDLWRKPLSLQVTLQRLALLLHDQDVADPFADAWRSTAEPPRGQPTLNR